MAHGSERSRWTVPVLVTWPGLLAAVLCWPLLVHPGLPLAKDLVFVPAQPLTDAALGLGDAAPRAVPLDAVIALLDDVTGADVLARLLVWLSLALAGWGVARLTTDLGLMARVAGTGFAVWNPFVVERLALGQWALLLGYAALPWVVVTARRYRDEGGTTPWAHLGCWVALASLTPTGGLLATATAVVLAAGSRVRTAVVCATCLVLQLPWLVPAFVGGSGGTSDPAGVDLFSAGDEGPGSVVTALVGLGGIWDAGSVPASREDWWTPAAAAVAVAVLVAGRRTLHTVLGSDLGRLVALAVGGFALALASSVPGGTAVMESVVEHVPGAGLLRDSHKFLAPYALLVALSLAGTVHRLSVAAARRAGELVLTVAILALPAPLVLLPDATNRTWPTVEPVEYPSGFAAVAQVLDGETGDLAVLPWRSYRGFAWGNGQVSSDPASRWYDRVVVVSQDLQIGSVLVRGEGERSRRIGNALATQPAADVLAREGVAWALVYLDDPAYESTDLAGLRQVYGDEELELYEVPDAEPPPTTARWRRLLVTLVDLLAAALVTAVAGVAIGSSARRRRRNRR